MPDPTEPRAEGPQTASAPEQAAPAPAVHPRGYTLADEEMERVVAKGASADVLDPIALHDPVGQSVEKVVMRVGLAVVLILVAGILLAQIACKNIQLSGIPNFATTQVSGETVTGALDRGVTWGGEIVRFPETAAAEFDQGTGAVTVQVDDGGSRTLEQLTASAQIQATALAMNLFRDPEVQSVSYIVRAPVEAETGAFAGASSGGEMGPVLEIAWQRDPADAAAFSCTTTGFDPVASSTLKSKLAGA